MGNRIAELGAGLVMVGLMLTLLVVLSGVFLIILILIFVFRMLLKPGARTEDDIPVQRLGLFDAPASNWWVDRYDQWLFRLEEILGINFSQTPARLFTGSMALAGISGSILAGAGYWLVGPEVIWPILFVAVLGNGLSAYLLARPMTAMFEPFYGRGTDSFSRVSGVMIGDPLDEEW